MPFNAASVIGDELYDYKADPLEKHNVVKEKSMRPLQQNIKRRCFIILNLK
jgi:hypothetical protein